ncbi:hypothetical protein [Terrimonas pollutisoli]|uniref:hypothetical protein n=1 Tax=Terrimonas pollutisoli TaxID=3034147 RepID=UPI0023EC3C0B|nr:hypothetical protein [Terrimonas sp. H1YJ31]
MKQSAILFNLKRFLGIIMLCLFQTALLAQDSTSSSTSKTTTTTTTTTTWYTQPWVWVLGGAIFILILFALMRGNTSSTTEKTTVVRDREV